MSKPKPIYAQQLPRWPFILLGLILAAVLVVAAVTWLRSDDTADGDRVDTSAVVTPADGCLGGDDASRAVVTAQTEAPGTPDGAAAFLGAYVRWQARDPQPNELPAQEVGERVWGEDVTAALRDDAVTRATAQGYHATLRGKHYSIREVQGNRVLVAMTIDLADTEGTVAATSGTVGWVRFERGRWFFDGVDEDLSAQALAQDDGQAFRSKLDADGVPFREAC